MPAEEAACREDNGADPDWACANCPKSRAADLSPYTHKLLGLYSLQEAGYPFRANDIEYQEWIDLGRLRQAVGTRKTACPMMG